MTGRTFIFAGSMHIADRLAREIGLAPKSWNYLSDEYNLRGIDGILVIIEADTCFDHAKFDSINEMLIYGVSNRRIQQVQISLDQLLGIKR